MKKILTYIIVALCLTTACGQSKVRKAQGQNDSIEVNLNFESVFVNEFAELIADTSVVVLDVRTANEFAEGHIARAMSIDFLQEDFLEKAKAQLPKDKTIAVYCRSGKRSATAAGKLSDLGYKVVNMKGGILAWKDAEMPLTTE